MAYTGVARANSYIRGVLSGAIPTSKWIRLACQRHLDDLARARGGWQYEFSELYAEHAILFIESLPHVKGKWARDSSLISLHPSQCFEIASLFGWLRRDDLGRRFRTAYIEKPRKNAKSTVVSGIGLYMLSVDNEPGAEVVVGAVSKDQAQRVVNDARLMAKAAARLRQHSGLTVGAKQIDMPDGGFFKAIATQTDSNDGLSVHCGICEELHEHNNREAWDVIESSMGARDKPLQLAITTAGSDTSGICYEQRTYAEKILDGLLEDDTYFAIIHCADPGDDPGDMATWRKANPLLGVSKTLVSLESEWKKAQSSPAKLGEFLRKHLGIWTSVGASALDVETFRRLANPALRIEDFAGRAAIIGIDLAVAKDFASVAAIIPDDERPPFHVFARHFLPAKRTLMPGMDHLKAWADAGRITTSPGSMLDLGIVEDHILKLCEILAVSAVYYDPAFAAQMVMRLEAAGVSCIELRQTPQNMTEPFQRMQAHIADGEIITAGDPVLEWMVGNTVAETYKNDWVRPVKRAPNDSIDGVSAMTTAFGGLCAPAEVPADPSASLNGYLASLARQQGAPR